MYFICFILRRNADCAFYDSVNDSFPSPLDGILHSFFAISFRYSTDTFVLKIVEKIQLLQKKLRTMETMEMIIPAIASPRPSPFSSLDFLYPIMLRISPMSETKKEQINPAKAMELLF